jgi:hypothetical protein
MKPKMLFVVLVIGMTLAVGSAFGQTMARANIPFDFNIGNSTLPSGEYTVSPVFAGNNTVLIIRSADWRQQVAVPASAAESAKTPRDNKLVFRRYGDQYFLSKIWVRGQALTLPTSHREREMARSTQVQEASIRGE